MGVDNIIKERRSIRDFKKKVVPWSKINEILESFIYAPCAGNLQNWKLIVSRNEGQLNKACYNQNAVVSCNFMVTVCSDNSELKTMYKEKGEFFAIQNNAAGVQNMLLKAQSFGIGSCWIGVYDENEVRAKLKIPKNLDIHAIIVFGYPKNVPETPLRANLSSILSFGEYGNKKRDIFPLKR